MLSPEAQDKKAWILALKSNGFYLDLLQRLSDGREVLDQTKYELLLVNCWLPDGDGIEWLRKCRLDDAVTPFVVVASSHDVENRVRALECGADDCIDETLDARELVAKLRAILRRKPIVKPKTIVAGNLELDVVSRHASIEGKVLTIPRREINLLEHFMLAYGRALTREYLEGSIYGIYSEVCSNSLEVRVSRLRRCLASGRANVHIRTLRGIGYMLEPL